jgi:hypothetical protein
VSTLESKLPLAGNAARPVPMTWWGHLLWIAAAGVFGMAVAAVFAGLLQLPRNLYLVFYYGLIGAFLYGYARWGGVNLVKLFSEHWLWGIIGGTMISFFTVQTVLLQPASPAPQGLELGFDLIWLGLVYGAVDALLLSVLPIYATWQALTMRGWTEHWPGRIAASVLAILASMLVIGLYHLGYPEFRGPQVLVVIAGVAVQSLVYLLARSPLAPVISHVAMHLAAVLYGISSVSQLPPHY